MTKLMVMDYFQIFQTKKIWWSLAFKHLNVIDVQILYKEWKISIQIDLMKSSRFFVLHFALVFYIFSLEEM